MFPAIVLVAAAAAGCAAPNLPAAIGPSGAAPAPVAPMPAALDAPAPDVAPAHGAYRLATAEPPLALIVRFKAGKRAKPLSKGRLEKTLRLARTQVWLAADASERDALLAELRRDPDVEWVEPDWPLRAFATPNDPLYGYQWPLPKIQAPAAWDLGRGAGVTVAVIDTGVDARHPDLAGQVLAGPDLVNGDADPADDQGHGTHVAGTVAALMGNGVGIAGLAPAARVLAVKVLGADGSGATSDIADGMLAAVERGAKVLNLSLGGPYDSSTLRAATSQAQQAGAVVVAAAGNDGLDRISYPAGYPGVLSVGATTSADARASFSNHGAWVNIAAPGEQIASTKMGGGYVYMNGTSMAAPHVAAAAALLRARRPDWGTGQVRDALLTSGAPASGFAANSALRRLDALSAMKLAAGTTATPAPSATPTVVPTASPSPVPTVAPTITPTPTPAPTLAPTAAPTPAPTATPTPSGDRTPPSIWGLGASNVKGTSASITWTTSEAADRQVEWGRSTALGSRTAQGTTYTTWHSVPLAGLSRSTTYYYRVHSRDRAGNRATSPIKSFRTASW